MHRSVRLTTVATVLSLGLSACSDSTGVQDSAQVTVAFSMSAPTASAQLSGPVAAGTTMEDVVITGTNGTLVITAVAFVVSEFKLERSDDACELGEGDDRDCETFETGREFVGLPLTGTAAAVVTETVPAGTYAAMKFEVADANSNGPGDLTSLLEEIHAAGFTDWPDDASLVVVGTFTPTDGEPRPFTAYFDAEIKVELDFDPALVIDGEDGTVDVQIDPNAWFLNADDTVIDLSVFDFATSGELVDFEAKMEHGFTKIELEGFND